MTKLYFGRVRVEPLDEQRLTDIERQVVANARIGGAETSSRRLFAVPAFALAVALAAVVGWKLHGDGGAVAPGAAPQTVQVANDAQRSTLQLGDATIASEPGSAFAVTRAEGRVVIDMQRGTVDFAVEHRPGRLFVVRAGETEIEDVGTKFTVAWDGHAADVRVREGAVKVRHQQQDTIVAKGQEWSPTSGVVAIAEPAATTTTTTAAAAAVEVAEAKPPVVEDPHAAAPAVENRAPAAVPARPAAAAHPRIAKAVEPTAPAAAAATRTTTPASDPYVDLKLAIRQQPIVGDPKIDGTGDAAAEIARLKKIAYSPTTHGDDASAAMYRIALLLHKPLKQDVEAMRTLEVYRRRFAAGRETSAVLWLRVRIACGHAIDDECRKAAYTYQQGASGGDAGDVAVRITNAP